MDGVFEDDEELEVEVDALVWLSSREIEESGCSSDLLAGDEDRGDTTEVEEEMSSIGGGGDARMPLLL